MKTEKKVPKRIKSGHNMGKKYEKPLTLYALGMEKVLKAALREK